MNHTATTIYHKLDYPVMDEESFADPQTQLLNSIRYPIAPYYSPGRGFRWATTTVGTRDFPTVGFFKSVLVLLRSGHGRWYKAVVVCWAPRFQAFGVRLEEYAEGYEPGGIIWTTRTFVKYRISEPLTPGKIHIWPFTPDVAFDYDSLVPPGRRSAKWLTENSGQ